MTQTFLDEDSLLSIAPSELPNRRATRYGGGGMSTVRSELGHDNEVRITLVYSELVTLLGNLRVALRLPSGDGGAPGGFGTVSPDAGQPAGDELIAARRVLVITANSDSWKQMVEGLRSMSAAPASGLEEMGDHVRQALHDVRGGALSALVLTLDFIVLKEDAVGDVLRAFYLTRDHLKIMRNAIEDLDSDARKRDLVRRDHAVSLLVEKWSAMTHRQADGHAAKVEVSSSYEGPVSQRCLEFAAVDRVLYNLMNNAVAFSVSGSVQLYIRRVGADVRFTVLNQIAPSHRVLLESKFGADLGKLYDGGFTVDGHGLGLQICGEFVAHAYGLSGAEETVKLGHVGATLRGDAFLAWFHWPAGD